MPTLVEAPPAPAKRDATRAATPRAQQRSPQLNTWNLLVITVTVASSAALLIAQQAAFRLLAPLVGSSIETWSTIIAVFLIGIALGNRLAGVLADKYSPARLVVVTLTVGALSLFSMLWLSDALSATTALAAWSLPVQIVVAATVVCLLPGTALSLVLQPCLRSVVTRADEMGAASGRIFAWSTLGSLFGNYLAGFVLLAFFGVRAMVTGTGWMLLALAGATVLTGWQRVGSRGEENSDTRQRNEDQARESLPPNWMWRALLIVIACSFVSGAVEGAAFRILAPLVGVSMFLTAGVIGAVLAGMSLGNFCGGTLATQYGTIKVLRRSLIGCAFATLLIAPLWKTAIQIGAIGGLGLIPQIVVWSFTLFFLPSFTLGLITPQVIRLSVADLRQAGTISGRLYAWSTLGCVAGILASSWLLIEALGAIRTSIVCGTVPALLMLLLRRRTRPATTSSTAKTFTVEPSAPSELLTWATLAAAAVIFLSCKSPYDRESKYFSLAIIEDTIEGREVKKLVLDRLVHSAIDLDDPSFLHYPHERVQGDYTRAAAKAARAEERAARILVIGGGGYSFPRWVEAQPDLSDVSIDVVEIDPQVTEIAYDRLGLARDTRINSYHLDGRQFVKAATPGSYDLVIQDAVNDYSVPYHLMTSEYNALIRRLLRPDGTYMLTVIDSIESGRFLASGIKTVQSVFPDTRVLAPRATAQLQSRSVFVIAGRGTIADRDDWCTPRTNTHVFPTEQIDRLVSRQGKRSPLLTDDYAPVDILMTSQFLHSAR